MSTVKPRPSLEGITLEAIVTRLSERMGWDAMGKAIPIRCFTHNPSVEPISAGFIHRADCLRDAVQGADCAV